MALRCFLFSSDEGTSDVIRQVLTGLDVEGETCPTATAAVEKVASEPFQIVIIDWDHQPEAGMVLSAARERKAADRPLTLAIVSDDPSVPKALQAGANSILRKPLLVNQVTDTLTTARDLIRSRLESAAKPPQVIAAAAASSSTLPASMEPGREKALRAGEFLQSAPLNPGGQFVTESENVSSPDQSSVEPVDQLKELEPVSAPAPPPPPPPRPDEPRGLEWYLKKNGIQRGGFAAAAPAPAPVPSQNSGPELLGYDQTPSFSEPKAANEQAPNSAPGTTKEPPFSSHITEPSAAAHQEELSDEPRTSLSSPTRFRLGKGAIIVASGLAACAILAAPQAPWHPQMKMLWARGQHSLHAWLNPQATTVVTQAPAAHEDFGRAGDEYKLPVAESIPDATTDPSKIQVVPEVDPTAKKPAGDATTPDQTSAPTDTTPTTPTTIATPAPDGSQTPAVQVQQNPAVQPAPPTASTTAAPVVSTPASTGAAVVPVSTPTAHTVDAPAVITTTPIPTTPASSAPPPPKRQPTPYVPVTAPRVPSSLQSQLAVMMPDASGNKPADAAMPAIEPVSVPELTERALLSNQASIPYPASAKGQPGTVILQVLIGRDGAVQDAKFLQGSLAFARVAIDGVRQWQFKPYSMNGRPVSVQTILTIKFKPGQ